jgi:hypothetical protein
MHDTALRVTSYFRNVLGTSNMVMVDFAGSSVERAGKDRNAQNGYASADDAAGIEAGRLRDEVLESLLGPLDERTREKAEREGTLPVLLVLRSMRMKGLSSGSQQALLVAPANMSLGRSDKGALSYPCDWRGRSPWIPRPLLEEPAASGKEAGTKEELAIGSYEAYSAFVSANAARRTRIDAAEGAVQWREYLSYCEDLFEAVAPDAEARLAEADAVLDEDGYVLVDTQVNASAPIEDLYHKIAERLETAPDNPALALYRTLTSIGKREQMVAGDSSSLQEMLDHAGTMSREYPFARSQKTAVHACAALGEGEVLAVSGPPGTGKTTLLESIVADTLVRYALEGRDAPVIVGTSTNNQAVKNIIDAFGKIEQAAGHSVFRRWLPDISYAAEGDSEDSFTVEYTKEKPLHSLGAYSPSSSKAAEARQGNYLVADASRNGERLYGLAQDRRFREQSEDVYAEEAEAFFGMSFDNAAAICSACQNMLAEVDRCRRDLIEAAARGDTATAARLRDWLALHGGRSGQGKGIADEALKNAKKLDDALDTSVRPLEFWLAVHYFESRWITCRKQRPAMPGRKTPPPEYDRKSKAQASLEMYRRQLACLMPLTVMTLYRLPGQLSCTDDAGQDTFSLGAIDLLIVDEAGQVDTSVGAAALALAKRAVIVGDTAQLPPVWNVDPAVDEQIAEGQMGLAPDEFAKIWNVMREQGLTASASSSLMKAAQAVCPWCHEVEEDGERWVDGGLFLSEHRRCLDEIISYSNELLYAGQLRPMRGGIDKRPCVLDLPAMGFCPVEGKAVRKGTSKKNPIEARAIASWIVERLPGIYDRYAEAARSKGKEAPDPASLVGVVTPFAAQMREVQQALKRLRKRFSAAFDGKRRPELDPESIVVGTAHRLQGAECPIILFSLVYDAGSSPSFVENNPNLMNVAVSRAKDSFILFGSERLVASQHGDSVMGLLNAYCFDHKVEPAEEQGRAGEAKAAAAEPASAGRTAAIKEPEPSGTAGAAAWPLALSSAIRWARSEHIWPDALPSTARDANSLLVQQSLIAHTETGYVPTERGRSLGISSSGNDEGRTWCTYSEDAIRKIAQLLTAPSGKDSAPAAPAEGEEHLSLTKAMNAAQKAHAWPDALPKKAKDVNVLLVKAGLLGENRLPTAAGRHLGISVLQGDGWTVAGYTPSVLAEVAKILLS